MAENLLPPDFVNGPISSKITMASSVSILEGYCTSLALDEYSMHVPRWKIVEKLSQEGSKKYSVSVKLPIVCPLFEPITGPFMDDKLSAKRLAALRACMYLNQCKELDDRMSPAKNLHKEELSFLFTHHPEVKQTDAGDKTNRRLYENRISEYTRDPAKGAFHLHLIVIKPLYPMESDRLKIGEFYNTSIRFGVLSPKPLPELCPFPVFDLYGTVEVHIVRNVKKYDFTKDEVVSLKKFHSTIFKDVLEVLRPYLIFDNSGVNSDMLLVVPMKTEDDSDEPVIDFCVVNKQRVKSQHLGLNLLQRLTLQLRVDESLFKIVTPWYGDRNSVYLVTDICANKTPSSKFFDKSYPTFEAYYRKRYGIKILNPQQPLLVGRKLLCNLNCINPRNRAEESYEEIEELLVPELVIQQNIPACLWIQARFLPTILHRLVYLLKLQELQRKIANDIGLRDNYLRNCPSLELDTRIWHSSRNVEKIKESSAFDHPEQLPSLLEELNKNFKLLKLEPSYPWQNVEEPRDIQRDLNVSAEDIDRYEAFMARRRVRQKKNLKKTFIPKNFKTRDLQMINLHFDGQSPNLNEFYTALTANEANDIVHFERLKVLGESFLLLSSTLYIFLKFPHYSFRKSVMLRSKIIGNNNLYYIAEKKNLGGIVRNREFRPDENWVPPCFSVPQVLKDAILKNEYSLNSLFNYTIPHNEQISGILSLETLSRIQLVQSNAEAFSVHSDLSSLLNLQYVSDKTLADSVRALLGAFFQCSGVQGGLKFVTWMNIIPQSENLENLVETVQVDPILEKTATAEDVDSHLPQWEEFEKRFGYHFNNRAFLLQALTHASYEINRITRSSEFFKYLGEAVLDLLITCYICEYCTDLSPDQVSDLKSALVNKNIFASVMVQCDLYKFPLFINSRLQQRITLFAEHLASKRYAINDEILLLIEEEDFNVARDTDIPKLLGDTFQALAGAVYLDSGKNLTTVWGVFYKMMWYHVELFSKNVPQNPIRMLQEIQPEESCFGKAFEVDGYRTAIPLQIRYKNRKEVIYGFGPTKGAAKRAAAKIALRLLSS